MALVKNGRLVVDGWHPLGDDERAPEHGPVLIPWPRWCAERAVWRQRSGAVGVRLPVEVRVAEVAPDLDRLALVALEFPKFGDGRPYTTARLLRERHHYAGEIRAVGDVFRDQLAFMSRCGFDAFDLKPGHAAEHALEAFDEIAVALQPAADGVPEALRWRRAARRGSSPRERSGSTKG